MGRQDDQIDNNKKKERGPNQKFNKHMVKDKKKKAPIPLTQKDRKKYITHRVAVVYNEEERKEYMSGFYGAKKRRKQEYLEKKKLKQKQIFKDSRKESKKVKLQQIDRFRQIIEQNDKELEALQLTQGFQKEKKEIVRTSSNSQVEIHTEFL